MARDASPVPTADVWLYRPWFAEDWNRVVLYDLASWVNGMAFRSIHFSPGGRPIIKIAELKNGVTGQTAFSDAEYEDCYLVSPGDMLFSWSGQPETSIDVFRWHGPEGWLNQHIFKVDAREDLCEPGFLYYLLRYLRPNFIAIARNKQTIGLGHVTVRDLQHIEIGLPSRDVQRAIAHILGKLDDKIDLNRQMNETLEQIAQAIFKSWFVDFDPVKRNIARKKMKHATASSDGALAKLDALFPDSFEELSLGEIPKEWDARPLDSVADFLNGLALQKYPAENDEYLPVIKIAELRSGVSSSSGRASVAIPPEYVVDDGDVLFSWSGSLEVVIWCGGKGALNQHLFKVTSRRYPRWFYYFWGKQHLPAFRDIASDKATTMGHIRRHHLSEALVVVPPQPIVDAADRVMSPLFARFVGNCHESRTLAAIRDALLPKLMSGEVRTGRQNELRSASDE